MVHHGVLSGFTMQPYRSFEFSTACSSHISSHSAFIAAADDVSSNSVH